MDPDCYGFTLLRVLICEGRLLLVKKKTNTRSLQPQGCYCFISGWRDNNKWIISNLLSLFGCANYKSSSVKHLDKNYPLSLYFMLQLLFVCDYSHWVSKSLYNSNKIPISNKSHNTFDCRLVINVIIAIATHIIVHCNN